MYSVIQKMHFFFSVARVEIISKFSEKVRYFQKVILILLNAPALINAPSLFSKKNVIFNMHEFLFASLADVAL